MVRLDEAGKPTPPINLSALRDYQIQPTNSFWGTFRALIEHAAFRDLAVELVLEALAEAEARGEEQT